MKYASSTLADLGELRLIEEVILPLAREFDVATGVGDDCAYLQTDGRLLAVSADVGPKPLLQNLPGYEHDLEAAGWLAVVATASDIATAGAKPFFLTNCIDSPPELLVSDFAVFLRGYFKACAEFGFRNGGGDVRHGPILSMRVFGAGTCDHGQKIGRGGVSAGDQLAIIGPAGVFMATYLLAAKGQSIAILDGKLTADAETILRYPRPQLKAMELLAKHSILTAASDTSDGLLGAIDNLARSSQCGFELHLENSLLHPLVVAAAAANSIDPWNIFFAWGDWSVAVTVPADRFNFFQDICEQYGVQWCSLGQATGNTCSLTARINQGQLVNVNPIRNENFISRGFNAGIKGHLDYILLTNLFSN
jgi:thiamine-monophosphate kinase